MNASDEPEAAACLAEMIEVLRRHGFTLGHEDGHGVFIITRRKLLEAKEIEHDEGWLLGAWLGGASIKHDPEKRKREAAEEFERMAAALTGTNKSNDSNQKSEASK